MNMPKACSVNPKQREIPGGGKNIFNGILTGICTTNHRKRSMCNNFIFKYNIKDGVIV